MADSVDTLVLVSGQNRRAIRLTNVSDGTGESAVVKIDKSAFTGPDGTEPTTISIEEIFWNIQGFTSIRLFWDHTTDDEIVVLSGSGYLDFTKLGGLDDPASSGETGDVILTTAGAVSGATYTIVLVVRFKD
jgi:hypothetical protein